MDIVNALTEKKQAALLVLPKADVTNNGQQRNQKNTEYLLMQLPASLSVAEFTKADNCKFLAATTSAISSSSSSSSAPDAQSCCCLVVESQGSSFELVKVETSNTLVLIPPSPSPSNTLRVAANDEPVQKKPKINEDDIVVVVGSAAQQLCSVPCRLLQAGGSGDSFLELRPKSLCLKLLRCLLQPHFFDPYNQKHQNELLSDWKGRTVESLALELLLTKQQVIDGLNRLKALALVKDLDDMDDDDPCCSYGLLSEEALLEAQYALVSTLAECNEFEHYATTEIPLTRYIQQAKKRMSETYPYVDQVLHHCIQTTLSLSNEGVNDGFVKGHAISSDVVVRLDIKKVAICVAKQLFLKQTEPWEEEYLLSRWQSDLPGVGEAYQVSLDLLRGVAICSRKHKKWKYFGTNQLPMEPTERFHALFQQQEMWSLEELEPYLQPLVEETNLSLTELLHKYTKVVQSGTGESVPYYTSL